jgi:multicomponent Na+:H+ antiporter subunit E
VTAFAFNLLLAVFWMFLNGTFTLAALGVGFAVGFAVVALHQLLTGRGSYFQSMSAIIRLAFFFVSRLWVAAWQLARDILRPRPRFDPVIMAYEARGLTPGEVALLSNLISLTPGSVSLDADGESGRIFVHSLYGEDSKAVMREIENYARLLRAIRGGQATEVA